MQKSKVALLVVAGLVFVALGFLLGQVAQAMINPPGSDGDPLVTQSYVEKTVSVRTAALTTRIEELEKEIATLKGGTTPVTTPPATGDTTDKTPDKDEPTKPVTDAAKVKVTGSSVNVRAKADVKSDKLGSVKKDDVLTLVSTSGDWYKVKMKNGTVGYIAKEYATPVK